MHVEGFHHFGGRHHESAALRHLLAHAGVLNPQSGEPLSEAMCFGIAGGIGAGYSFCPSIPRHGAGSGVAIVGRYKSYATSAAWYEEFCDRIGAKVRITETGGAGKAYQNLAAEIAAGRPAVVWCSRALLPYLADGEAPCNFWMHSFIVYAIDEEANLAHGSDIAATKVTLTLDDLAAARAGVCSHKNRTLTLSPPKRLTTTDLVKAARLGIRACATELLEPRMKTFSLQGLETWARMVMNSTNKDGWLKVFNDGTLYMALRDVFHSIETSATGGSLYRNIYADFLDEAALLARNKTFADLAAEYRGLGRQWTRLAEAALPDHTPPFRLTKELLRRKHRLFTEKGERAQKEVAETANDLQKLEQSASRAAPLSKAAAAELLENLREQITALHQAETAAAESLKKAVS